MIRFSWVRKFPLLLRYRVITNSFPLRQRVEDIFQLRPQLRVNRNHAAGFAFVPLRLWTVYRHSARSPVHVTPAQAHVF